ncbi:TM0106 family RecB-like putative nuclease [Legionella oakridgensis]|uniref:TM0106 family RecB-like putative nuclease n=1 Tax=Legionella oakridgensis TaxID=29423 RepID=UPI0003DE1B42|nr:TM0106 family RecB-like putative nuclease [Legionella oakridgensis]ETO92001.1 putative nuclease [Legionella oakridgensis RV-2-2007]ETO92057.1 RecB family nuclease, putative, TM0106 family [Legionella oakridgensis RV-2-2007]
MHFESDQIIYSPSDLTLYMESPFASLMEHLACIEPCTLDLADKEDPLLSVLQHKGLQFEQEILTSFVSQGLQVVSIERGKNAYQDTLNAMHKGVDIIYQAALSLHPFKGYADFLIKVEGGSDLGAFHYEPWDIKLSKTVKPQFVIQLCCYAEMLEVIQNKRPNRITIVTGDKQQVQLATNEHFYYYLNLKDRFIEVHGHFSKEDLPDPTDSDRFGRWSTYANERLFASDHLSQVATITKSQIKKLNKAGIKTMQSLIELSQLRVKGIQTEVLQRLQLQANIQKMSMGKEKPLYELLPYDNQKKSGLALLPPASPLDVYFDIEGFPLVDGGLEYLWGIAYFDEKGVRQYKDFWAHDKVQEQTAFQSFIEWVFERWQRDPHMHIYHYANYEIAACRKLMGRYGICEAMVDTLLRNEVFVDLYKIVKGCLRLGEPRYSIKNVEHLYRGKRDTEVGSGGDSVVVYERWREDPDGDSWESSSILKAIRDYNIDDCHSTQELVDWLRARQQENGIFYLGKTEIVPEPENETITESIRLRDKLLEKANHLKTQALEQQSKVASLFAWILEFHRREKKPMYWRLFDRLGSSFDELFDDIDCLAYCVRTDKAPYKPTPRSKNLAYEYRFDPSQEFKAATDKYKVLGEERPDGKTLSVTVVKEDSRLNEGIIVLQTGANLSEVVTLIPDEDINAEPIPTAIMHRAEQFYQGQLENTAIHDFLMRHPPRIIGMLPDLPIAPSHEPVIRLTQIISAVINLNNSYLTIQGPPGSGKTYTAKHIIAELLKQGKRIGISSNSHKAINHLLISTAEYCKKEGIPAYFACTKETDESLTKLGISIFENKSIAGNLRPSCVIGTTAWGFARPDLENSFDYLFIDEAGQVSVANLIAMSCATKNIILMGDQMQLGQPSQGSHPEESGASILDYLLHTTPTIPENMGVFLGTTYRMHSAVNQFISDAIYEGKLESAVENDKQRILVPEGYQGILNKEAGIIAVAVMHESNTQASDEEVEQIVFLTQALLGRTFIDKDGKESLIDWQDILYVAPYNHQVNKLRQALGGQAKVGSVDKFQGQEAPIVFLSMCASSGNESPRGIDFLFNKNRMNVAISRAQCMAIIVYSPMLLDTCARNLDQMEMVNLFCRLLKSKKYT